MKEYQNANLKVLVILTENLNGKKLIIVVDILQKNLKALVDYHQKKLFLIYNYFLLLKMKDQEQILMILIFLLQSLNLNSNLYHHEIAILH